MTITTIDSFNNVSTVDVKRAALAVDPPLSYSLLPLRVTRARGFSIAVMSNIAVIVTFECRCQGLNNIWYTLASQKKISVFFLLSIISHCMTLVMQHP